MMMNRKRLGRVMAVVAVVLAAFFLLSSVLMGFGTNVSYNLFDLIGGQNQTQQQDQGPSPQDAIEEAEKDLKNNPKDPDAITDLAGVYAQNGQYEDAARVLEDGRKEVLVFRVPLRRSSEGVAGLPIQLCLLLGLHTRRLLLVYSA